VKKSDFTEFLQNIWQHKPVILVVFAVGLLIFLLFVVDTHLHRKKRKGQHQTKRKH